MTSGVIQQRLTRLAGQGHDAFTGAARAWAAALEHWAGGVPDPATVVRAYFDLAEEVLRIQRAAALDVLRIAEGNRAGRS